MAEAHVMAGPSSGRDKSVKKNPRIVGKKEVTGRRDGTSGLGIIPDREEKKIGMEKYILAKKKEKQTEREETETMREKIEGNKEEKKSRKQPTE